MESSQKTRKTLASTTLAQFFSFGLFVSSTIIGINNLLDLRYRQDNLFDGKDAIAVLDDCLRVVGSFAVMLYSTSSPFEEDDPFEVSLRGDKNSLYRVLFFASLCFTAMSEIVEDPNVLFTEFRTILFSVVNTTQNVLEPALGADSNAFNQESTTASVIDQALDVVFINNFGEDFAVAMLVSKAFCFAAGLLYAGSVMLSDLPDCSVETRHRFWESVLGRVWQLVVIGFNVYAMFALLSYGNLTDRASLRRLRQLASVDIERISDGINGTSDWTAIYDTSSTGGLVQAFYAMDGVTMHSITSVVMLVVSGYITLFYNKSNFALVPLAYLSVQNLVLVEESTDAEIFYGYFFVVTMVMLTSTAAMALGEFKIDDFLRFLPNLLYKAGLILLVVCLPFLVLGWTHSWAEIDLEPGDLTSDILDRLQYVDDRIESVYDKVAGVLSKINPCVRPLTIDVDTALANATSLEEVAASVDEEIINSREDFVKTGIGAIFYDLSDCIRKEYPYEWDWSGIRKIRFFKRLACKRLKEKEDNMRQSIMDEITKEVAENAAEGVPFSDLEISHYYVNEHCEKAKCYTFTALTAVLLILVKVPVIGSVCSVINSRLNVGMKFWRFALRLFKKTPRLLKKRNSLKKLKNRIKKLMIAKTKRSITPTQTLTWIFFPVLVSAGIALTLIMIRRQRAVGNSKFAEKFVLAMRIAISLAFPVLVSELVVYVVMLYYPVFVNRMLDALPGVFVRATLEIQIGLESMKIAYLLSMLGNACIMLSAAAFVETEFDILIIRVLRRILRFLFATIIWVYIYCNHFVSRLIHGRAGAAPLTLPTAVHNILSTHAAYGSVHSYAYSPVRRSDERIDQNEHQRNKDEDGHPAYAQTFSTNTSASNNIIVTQASPYLLTGASHNKHNKAKTKAKANSKPHTHFKTKASTHHHKQTHSNSHNTSHSNSHSTSDNDSGSDTEQHSENKIDEYTTYEKRHTVSVRNARRCCSLRRSITVLKLGFRMLLGLSIDGARLTEQEVLSALDWKVQYLQPLSFSLFTIPFIIRSTWDMDYVVFQYNLNGDVARTSTEIADTAVVNDETSDIMDEFNDIGCGIIAKMAELTLLAVKEVLRTALKPFADALDTMTNGLSTLQGKLVDLLEFDVIQIPDVFDKLTTNILVYGIPVGITVALAVIWIASLFGSTLYIIRPLRRFVGADRVSLDDAMAIFAGAILAISISMIMVHLIIGGLFQTLSDTNIPYFNFSVSLGWKYYMVIIAHMCNAMSAIAHYVNTIVPPINYS